ncbi:conjugal transfer protein [Alkalicoccobacillus gibsonii]|uniref:Conjugal transfer protein n=1 Tax=Alkalicoccobacillus gibsonii TaxID=79881 RepID=A0ABU9VEI8_9BACI
MKILERFKNRTKQIKVPRKRKSPMKKDHSKRTALAVWSLLGSIFVLSILTILLSVNTRSGLNTTNAMLNHEEIEVEETMSQPLAEQFLSGFISTYINVTNTNEAIEERKQNLREYMVHSNDFQDERNEFYQLSDIQGDRVLKSYSLFDVQDEQENETLFQYKVTFTNRIHHEKEVEIEQEENDDEDEEDREPETEIVTEAEETDQTLLLSIPVQSQENQFAVSGVPYFSEVPTVKGVIEQEEEERAEAYTGEEIEPILTFLNTFFARYASEPKEELAYMMKEPTSLNGAFELDELTSTHIVEKEEGYQVFVTVLFRGVETNIPHVVNMELDLQRHEGNFFIETMQYQ